MDGSIEGWINRWMDGWMMKGWIIDGWMMKGWMDGSIDGWIDGWGGVCAGRKAVFDSAFTVVTQRNNSDS